jgi:glutamate-1-semialdehyde 2,1-aminomutase
MDKTRKLHEKARKLIPEGTRLLSEKPELRFPEIWPVYYKEARGCVIRDLDDRQYTDMSCMDAGSCILGYADEDVDGAVKAVIEKGSTSTLDCPEKVELAELLCEIHPWADRAGFAGTGKEAACMAAGRARARTGRDTVLFCGRCYDNPSFAYNDVEGFLEAADKNKGKIAAVVMEPARDRMPEKNFLEIIRERTQKEGTVLIFDETMCGWRLNLGGAHMGFGVKPDMAIFAKSTGNGYPVTAIIGTAEAMDDFGGAACRPERIGAAAAVAAIRKMRKHNIAAHLVEAGKTVGEGWKKAAEKQGLKIEVKGVPLLSYFSFCYDGPLALEALFSQFMLEKGFLAANVFRASYAHKKEDVEKYLKAAEESFGGIVKAIEERNPAKYGK